MRKTFAALISLAVLAAALPAPAQEAAPGPAYDAAGWRADLAQVREAFATRYANLEWAQTVREADLGAQFDAADARLAGFSTDAQARELFDGFATALADRHVKFNWPAPAAAPPSATAPSPCDAVIGRRVAVGATVLAGADGYTPLATPQSAAFPAGLLTVDGRRIGVIRVAEFSAGIAPTYCDQALAAGRRDDLYEVVHDRLTRDFAVQLGALRTAGAQILVVDLTGNRGGSDWAEALVRMVTARRLVSTRVAFMRGEHWAKNLDNQIEQLEVVLKTAEGRDRALLEDLIAQLKARRAEAVAPCDASGWLRNQPPTCAPLVPGFYGSGLLASADPKSLAGKDWAGSVFSPMWYPYEEGAWSGPLLVAVDNRTASAAEQFTAVLQDNAAAVIVGDPTAGAGCGYTWGGTPVTLKHSKGVLRLPDCARIRGNGDNEVIGVSPDVVVGFHAGDGPRARARRLAAALPAALAKARP